MKRFMLVLAATALGLVLLLGFKTNHAKTPGALGALAPISSAAPSSATPSTGGTPTTVVGPTTPSGPSATPSSTTPPSAGTTIAAARTALGSVVRVTEGGRSFGSVQVKATVQGGKITNIDIVQYPQNDSHSQQISQFVIPILTNEALTAQSANINAISGATYTSQGYAQSLQAALDKLKA